MKKFNNNGGFTLIEIIVVLIIVGILASIALPSLFNNVQTSRTAEALGVISGWKPNMTACLEKFAGNEVTCTDLFVGMPVPTACFSYALTTLPTDAAPGYVITASTLANTCGFGAAGAGTITMTADNATDALICQGFGALAGVC